MLGVLLGMLQISMVSLLIILSRFLMSGLENGMASYAQAIRGSINEFWIFIFCVRLAGELVNSWLCCLIFLSVISFCRLHFSNGVRCMPKYIYDSF